MYSVRQACEEGSYLNIDVLRTAEFLEIDEPTEKEDLSSLPWREAHARGRPSN